ncbi:HNH endonuclease [Rhodococcus sp. USK10]|uniref:HNH endonuclease n=1 Tax=Rhodococcus sp. USK10 TaxID=2789739 RepID=UPI001C5D3BAB|nr:HNH endonuclease signature motif containing protein [Rhodococcus sp. USK10]QYB01465.1 HNH endonuclease [Rhodococcus sp. USK10]
MLHRDGYRCRQCGYQGSPHAKPADVEADHIVNVADGGAEFDLANGQALCVPHHKRKSAAEAAKARTARSRLRPIRRHPGRIDPPSKGGGTPLPPGPNAH